MNGRTNVPNTSEDGSVPSTGIACRAVSAGYFGKRVLQQISFAIEEPAIYVVLGPNGAGKTTLLRTLSGILPPYEGQVYVNGSSISRQEAHNQLHYLSHMDGIPDGLRVGEALRFYARLERASSSDIEHVLDLLELRELSGQYLSRLSAGQRKRVSIARIFLRERAVYLLDEPTSNLDPKVAREIREVILKLSREKIVLYSSHNLFEAREIGRYVLAIKDGHLTLFDRMENLRAARFVIGVRVLAPTDALAKFTARGDYFLRELSGPEEVPKLIRDLESQGVQIREIREMENPLEDLFV